MVTLQTGNVKIVTKLLTGSFPKYEAVMPDKVGQVAVIPKDKLTAALKDLKAIHRQAFKAYISAKNGLWPH